MAQDPVREALERQSANLSAKVAAGRPLESDELAQLELLSRLKTIHDDFAAPRKNWWPPVAFAATLAILSALLFVRVAETDVKLDLALSELDFSLVGDQAPWEPMRVDALGISGMSSIQAPSDWSAPPDASAMRIAGSATLAPAVLPTGTAMSLRSTGVDRQYTLSFQAPQIELRAGVTGPLTIAFAGSAEQKKDAATPRAIVMRAGRERADMDFVIPSVSARPFAPELRVEHLNLSRIDEFSQDRHTFVRRVSTILSGKVYFESLGGSERSIRSGEALQFQKSSGEFRELRLKDGEIELQFYGRVGGMTTGVGDNQRSLMPTYLDWLRARHGPILLWGSAMYLFGLITAALRWWGVYK